MLLCVHRTAFAVRDATEKVAKLVSARSEAGLLQWGCTEVGVCGRAPKPLHSMEICPPSPKIFKHNVQTCRIWCILSARYWQTTECIRVKVGVSQKFSPRFCGSPTRVPGGKRGGGVKPQPPRGFATGRWCDLEWGWRRGRSSCRQ